MSFSNRELYAIDTALLYRVAELESRIRLWGHEQNSERLKTTQSTLQDTQSAANKIKRMILGEI